MRIQTTMALLAILYCGTAVAQETTADAGAGTAYGIIERKGTT